MDTNVLVGINLLQYQHCPDSSYIDVHAFFLHINKITTINYIIPILVTINALYGYQIIFYPIWRQPDGAKRPFKIVLQQEIVLHNMEMLQRNPRVGRTSATSSKTIHDCVQKQNSLAKRQCHLQLDPVKLYPVTIYFPFNIFHILMHNLHDASTAIIILLVSVTSEKDFEAQALTSSPLVLVRAGQYKMECQPQTIRQTFHQSTCTTCRSRIEGLMTFSILHP